MPSDLTPPWASNGRPHLVPPSPASVSAAAAPRHGGTEHGGTEHGGEVPPVRHLPVPGHGAGRPNARPAASQAGYGQFDYGVVRALHEQVSAELAVLLRERGTEPGAGTIGAAGFSRAEGERIATRRVAAWIDEQRRHRHIPNGVEDELLAAVLAELAGLGRLQRLIDDPAVENINILGFDGVRVEYRDGTLDTTALPVADSDEELVAMVANLARRAADSGSTERSLSPSRPFLDLQLPDGSRLTSIYQISQRPVVAIRRHGALDVTLADLVGPQFSMIDPLIGDFLTAVMTARLNILVAGWPGAGKTTLVRALGAQIPQDEWFVTMEESRELGFHTTGTHPWAVSLEARQGHGEREPDGRPAGEITLDDLIPLSLRLNTARIIVGEVRDQEIVAMLQAAGTTGGSLATLHARGPEMVMDRLVELVLLRRGETSPQRAYRQVANAIDYIVYVEMIDETTIGGRKHRFVSHVLEIDGLHPDGQGVCTTTVFGPPAGEPGGRAVPQHLPERHLARLLRTGYDPQHLNTHRGVGAWPRPLDTIIDTQAGGGWR